MHTETNDDEEEEEEDDDDDDDDESARFFRTTTTKKKTENEFGSGEKKKNTRILIFSVLALLLFLLYWRSIRLTSSTHSTDDRAEAMAMAAKEDEIMRNLRYPGSTTTTTIGKKKRKKEFTSGKVKVLVDTNLQNEKEIKREGRKLLQFLAPVRYSLVPLSDAIQDLVEAMFDLSITPLQAKIAPFLKFRESNVTDPKDPLVIDKEKVKEAIIKETLP